MRNPIIVVVAGLTIAGAAMFFWRWAPGRTAQSDPTVASSEQETTRDELDALRREVASLKGMTAAQALRTAAVAQPAAAEAAAKTDVVPRRPKRVDPVEQKAVLTETLEGQFRQEAKDPTWSAERANAIKGAFAQSVPGTRVLSADCGTSLCRVVVQHDDSEHQTSLMESTADVPDLSTGETFYLFDKEAAPPRTTLYMARAGKKLPRPPL